ncbi:MAG: restriction endonuclease subunit S [Treponema sp.]|jgi:type I restriction enzyme S subunit|nr:restriction endonuclease subunit S [Treponema sp.]NPV38784.1 restriction endonuclease subunit S [Brevinematales bacterium]
MKGWREYRLEQFAILVKDIYKPNGKDEQKYIGLEHIEQETLRLNSVGNSTDVISNKFLFQANDILFGKLRPYFRKVIKPKFSGICSTDIWVFRAKEGFSQDFLFYFLANWDFVNTASSGEGGTRMPRADWKFLSKTKWLLPPLPEQKAIAAVLSSLDDKIDLLHRQNKTLEAMAETLFRQWFVEPCKNGLPEGWEEKSLEECVNIGIGRTPPRQEYQWFTEDPKGIKWISIKDLGNNGVYIFDTDENLTHEAVEKFNIPIIPKDTVVLSFKMTIGRVGITSEDMVSNEAIAHFKFNQKTPFSLEYLYLFLKLYQYDTLGSTSSIVTAINSNMIKQITILIPENTIMDRFNHFVAPLFKKIRENQIQIYTLEKLRDLLLPKLMSGEVRVEYNGD